MEKLKKYFRYVILLIITYILVSVYTNFCMRRVYKQIDYTINSQENIEIKVDEVKTTNEKGYIKGIAINNTKEHLTNKYLQFDFYNEKGYLITTEYKEIKYFNVDEKTSFYIEFKYKNINKIEISFTDKKV